MFLNAFFFTGIGSQAPLEQLNGSIEINPKKRKFEDPDDPDPERKR